VVIPTASATRLVLVVDDDRFIRELVAACLEEEPGVRAALAADGQEALRLVAHERPDALVLDLAMPRVDGYEVCRRLKADPATRAIPVIAMSAGERQRAAFDAGCDDFVAKPFDLEELVAAVRRLIGPTERRVMT
jgi:CheY-like chemotaxis protein